VRRATPFLVAAALLAGGCAEPAIPQATASDLQRRVAEIRAVVEDGRIFAARQQLVKLAAIVNRLLEDEEVGTDTALEILAAVEDVESALPQAPERSSEPEPTTPPPSPEEEGGNGHGNEGDKDSDEDHDQGAGND
jgi:hypothetical protein